MRITNNNKCKLNFKNKERTAEIKMKERVLIKEKKNMIEGVAQLVAAADSRSAGWGFESLRPQNFLNFSFFFPFYLFLYLTLI